MQGSAAVKVIGEHRLAKLVWVPPEWREGIRRGEFWSQ